MELKQNISLSDYSTMRLGGPAKLLLEVSNVETMIKAVEAANRNNLPVVMIGGGSNIIWRDEGFPGLVLVNQIKGFSVALEDDTGSYLTIGAGENWDSVVERSVSMGLTGIECLSLIPGTAGATPIQNVGAYGQEIAQTLMTVAAYDTQTKNMVTLTGSDCRLSYRKSIFNTSEKGRYLITSITLMLNKSNPLPPFYTTLSSYLEANDIKEYTPASIRQAVVDIRKQRLPNPSVIANNGSFFANPIVDRSLLENLQDVYDQVPNWPTDNDQVKLSAAWLIERCGFNDYFDKETGMATWETQPLIFVNRSAKSTADLIKFVEKVRSAVRSRFSIELTQEPLLLP